MAPHVPPGVGGVEMGGLPERLRPWRSLRYRIALRGGREAGNAMRSWLHTMLCLTVLSGCAVGDSRLAQRARTRLLGMREVDLVACLGSPDQHSSFPGTDVLTWYAASNSSLSFSPPIIGGFAANNGGYCHVTARVDGGLVTHVIYSGEKNATLAPDAYCAPVLRSCLAELPPRGSPGPAASAIR